MTSVKLAIEWFLNPDHLPFIVAQREGLFEAHGIDFELIEPDAHYDGLEELKAGNIAFATNEPLHLIEQFDPQMLSLGTFFETKGGVLLKADSYDVLARGGSITVTTPVSNHVTDTIGFEIIRRYYARQGIEVSREQVRFAANGFEHLQYLKEGADAAWLYFDNFEGVEARAEGMDVLYLDAENAGFANFSALDLFVNRPFMETHPEVVDAFITAVRAAISVMKQQPKTAREHYYAHTAETPCDLMDAIIDATLECFDADFASEAERAVPILNFFREIGVTSLEESQFRTAFLN